MVARSRTFERGCIIVGIATFVAFLTAQILAKHNTIFTTASVAIIWAPLLPGALLGREYYLILAREELLRKRPIEKGVAAVAIVALCAFVPVGLVSAVADQLANSIGRRIEIPVLVEKLHDNGKPMKCRYKATLTLPPSNERHQVCVSEKAFRTLGVGEPDVAHARDSAIGVALLQFGTRSGS